MSARTALQLGTDDGRQLSYTDFAQTLSDVLSPSSDFEELFKRIALTVLINNVDDHWRNHGFLRGAKGWQLSPVFDINPSSRHGPLNSRPLTDDADPRHRDIRNLSLSAGYYGIQADRAKELLNTVADAVEQWPALATNFSISLAEQECMAPAFDEEQRGYVRELVPDAARAAPLGSVSPEQRDGDAWVSSHSRGGESVSGYWRRARP
jgi:serine/threonine-protein kinase HipA